MRYTLCSFPVLFLLLILSGSAAAAAEPDSLSVKIGQMIMIGFRGLTVENEPSLAADIRERGIGGVVLFDYDVPAASTVRNIESPRQLARLTADLQQQAQIPLFIAIDQEGGRVNRLKPSRGFAAALSAAHLGRLDNADSTRGAANATALMLKKLNINMNLAPVADLNTNPSNPVIGRLERSFSAEPGVVSRHAKLTAETYRGNGIIPVLKHFPGHGSSATDTHRDFTDVTASWSTEELDPYRNLIRSGYSDPVMTAHIYHAGLDRRYPATLSKKVVTGLLRHDLGFRGIVISDDLQMKAVADRYSLETAIRLALDAGIDILLFANNSVYDPAIAAKASAIIRSLVGRNIVDRKRIDRSYNRIMELKEHYLFRCK
jgi:beta-N-acetylhexosaminidase